MIMQLTSKISRFFDPQKVIWVMVFFVLLISVYENFVIRPESGWKEVIASDGRGYYAYLPSVFVYGEIGFENVVQREKEIYPGVKAASFIVDCEGHAVNKYFLGVALLMAPFFLLGSLLSVIFGMSPDGYNSIYQFMASVSALFYLFVGLVFLRKLLKLFQFNKTIIIWVLMLVVFATHLLIYTVAAPAMSHTYSFAAVAGFICFAASYFRDKKKLSVFFSLVFLALIVLIRPVNGIVILLLPFLAKDNKQFIDATKSFFKSRTSSVFILVGIFILSLQPVWWYLQTGNWLLWSYSGEGFYFLEPQIFNVLFSFQKGLFVYTPVYLLALFGLVPLFKSGWVKGVFVLLFLAIYVWIVSSWWNWYYGDGFSQRVFIDILPVVAVLLAFLFRWVSGARWLYTTVIALSLLMIALNLFQSWQYSRGIIHPYAMDREKYAVVFMRFGNEYRYMFNGVEDIPPYMTNMDKPVRIWKNDFEKEQKHWVTSGRAADALAHSGGYISRLNGSQQYSSALKISRDSLLTGKRNVYARIKAWIFETQPGSSKEMKLVVSLADSTGSGYYFRSVAVDEMPVDDAGYWREVGFGVVLPEILNLNDQMKIFFWYRGEPDILVDDFGVEIFCKGR
jgi:hypothetical protein